MGFADEAAAEDGVRLAVEYRLEELGVIGGIVLKVGILNNEDVAGYRNELCKGNYALAL